MGNNNGKKSRMDPHEVKLEECFSSLSIKSTIINYSDLRNAWAKQLDPYLYNILENHFKKKSNNGVSKDVFKSLYCEMVTHDEEEKAKNILRLISNDETTSKNDLLQFVVSIIKSVILIQDLKSVKSFKSWSNRSTPIEDESALLYGQYFVRNVNSDTELNWESVKHMLEECNIFLTMIFSSIYEIEGYEFYAHLYPKWKYDPVNSVKMLKGISLLDLVKILFINMALPLDYQDEWRLLFSSAIHGESFSRLSGQIINEGPTVIIIKDKDDHIFGGFAPGNWIMSPNFAGDSRSFLFKLEPEMEIYSPTGFNSNFQYMNVGQQTLPNGLGLGGKLEYFGIWLSADYGSGYCSESCTTYRNYKMLSGVKNFRLSHVEVWGVGPPPPSPADLGERSVLDGNIEAQAMLELAGKTKFSEGLREEPND